MKHNITTKLKLTFYFCLFTFAVLVLASCTPTEPPVEKIKPGRRDYTWTVDTLNYPYTTYYRMWGSSPMDVWITSSGTWDKSVARFLGTSWSAFGLKGIIVPNAIYGFSSHDIYIGAGNGKIWKFNGVNWELYAEIKKDGHSDIVFSRIWGESPDNFYAFGAYGDEQGYFNKTVIVRLSNFNKWILLDTNNLNGLATHVYKNKDNDFLYISLIKMGRGKFPDSTLIYEYNNGKFKKIYGSIETKGKQANISLINGEVYFMLGNRIAKRDNNEFQTFLEIDNPDFYQRMWGRNSKDIFLFMTSGLVHYNGSDMKYLFRFDKKRTQIFGSAIFEKEVFFLVYESQTGLNLIYHGKLNNGG